MKVQRGNVAAKALGVTMMAAATLAWAGASGAAPPDAASENLSVVSLRDCELTAAENHPSIRLANREVHINHLKELEAFRAILPSVTLKGEETSGKAQDAGTPDFKERSYGVQFAQSLFRGGKLYRTYRQTRAHWLASKAKLVKSREDVVYNVREAYWNLVRGGLTLSVYERALTDLEKEKDKARELLEKDIIPQQIFLTVNSQYRQAGLQSDSAKADLEARLWQWTAALGLKEPPEYRPKDASITVVEEHITLDECLALAGTAHPDILVQRYTAEAAGLGSQVAGSYFWPQLDMNGFYGRSGGAFKSETLNLKEDWQLGLRASMYFGGSSLNVSGLKQKTSPKLGQSSRTEIETISTSVGLIDNFKQKSDYEDAELVSDQARVQLEKTRMDVLNGVRDAYAAWKKATAQLTIAENDLELARADFAVAGIKSSHREVPFSERAVTRNKVAQAEAALIETQAAYNIVLATLNRAVGIPDRFGSHRE